MTINDPDRPQEPRQGNSGQNDWDVPDIPMMKVEAELVDWTKAALGAEDIKGKIEELCKRQMPLPEGIRELKYVGITEVPGGLAFRFRITGPWTTRIDYVRVELTEQETYLLDQPEVSKKVLQAIETGLPKFLR